MFQLLFCQQLNFNFLDTINSYLKRSKAGGKASNVKHVHGIIPPAPSFSIHPTYHHYHPTLHSMPSCTTPHHTSMVHLSSEKLVRQIDRLPPSSSKSKKYMSNSIHHPTSTCRSRYSHIHRNQTCN